MTAYLQESLSGVRVVRSFAQESRHIERMAELNELKGWLGAHNAAVMTVLFLVLGVDLVAKGIGLLSS